MITTTILDYGLDADVPVNTNVCKGAGSPGADVVVEYKSMFRAPAGGTQGFTPAENFLVFWTFCNHGDRASVASSYNLEIVEDADENPLILSHPFTLPALEPCVCSHAYVEVNHPTRVDDYPYKVQQQLGPGTSGVGTTYEFDLSGLSPALTVQGTQATVVP